MRRSHPLITATDNARRTRGFGIWSEKLLGGLQKRTLAKSRVARRNVPTLCGFWAVALNGNMTNKPILKRIQHQHLYILVLLTSGGNEW